MLPPRQRALGERVILMSRLWTAVGVLTALIAVVIAAAWAGLLAPGYKHPGLYLSGEVAATPSDWGFTREVKYIAIEVQTPYLLPHSVVISCADVDGDLYVSSRDPETKRWPAWVDRDPNVRLGISSKIYEARLVPIEDPDEIYRIREKGFWPKYSGGTKPKDLPPARVWRVAHRS
jgi:hypothetical protein